MTDLPPGDKVGYNPFIPRMFAVIFFGHTESIENLPGAETHWQDNDPSVFNLSLTLATEKPSLKVNKFKLKPQVSVPRPGERDGLGHH